MRSLLIGLTWFLLLAPALAWNEEGHRVVAIIAERQIPAQVKMWATKTLAAHPSPSVRNLENAAPWPDVIRSNPRYHHGTWHYINLPIFLDIPSREMSVPGEVLYAINLNTHILKDPHSSRRDKAIALSWIIHLIGDIHQPMHAITGYSQKLPKGDRGGNLVEIQFGKAKTNLHAFWDSCGGLFWRGANKNRLHNIVDNFTATPPTSAQITVRNPVAWADESFLLAKDIAYAELPSDHILTDLYLDHAKKIASQRMTLAGYRLADYLKRLYASTSSSSSKSSISD